jgi:transposase InsO family protein
VKRYVPRTTDSTHGQPVADNLLDRDFAAALPNTKWAADITYVPTEEGWLYLAAVIDLCSGEGQPMTIVFILHPSSFILGFISPSLHF